MSERRNRTSHSLRILALAAVLGVTTVALSQCRMVQDNVTGISMTAGSLSGRSHCAHSCNDIFEAAIRAEESRHRAELRSCGNDRRCKDAENKLHDKLTDKIEDARKACKKGCYNEGGGNGGGHGDK